MGFYHWLDEEIYTGFGCEKIPRKEIITIFVRRGLYPFIENHGWRWAISPNDLKNHIANGLYKNRGKSSSESNWLFPSVNTQYDDEYLARFNYTVGCEAWDEFWSEWGLWNDIDSFTDFGLHRRLDIQQYVWSQINIDASPESRIVDELLFDDEEMNQMPSYTTKRESDDIYLHESAESGQYGGYRR